jgi:transposase
MRDPADRIRELEDRCEALSNAIEEIHKAVFVENHTLPNIKRILARILVPLRKGTPKP